MLHFISQNYDDSVIRTLADLSEDLQSLPATDECEEGAPRRGRKLLKGW